MTPKIDIPAETLAAFCRRWRVAELALFGSVLRDDFQPDSDVDVLVTFADDARWSGWDVVEAMIPESEIRDLIVELRSATAGVGTFRSRFDHLAELTGRPAQPAVQKARAKAA